MKIYANRSRNELDKFVGQDTWVLVECLRKDNRTGESYWGRIKAWIRILSATPTEYKVNLMMYGLHTDNNEFYDKEIYLDRVKTFEKDRFRLAHPVEMCTTAELFNEE